MKLATKEDIYKQFELYASIVKEDGGDDYVESLDYKAIIDKLFFTPDAIKEVYAVDEEKFLLDSEEKRCRIWAFKDSEDPNNLSAYEPITAEKVYVYMPLFVTGILQNGANPLMQTRASASWFYPVNQSFDGVVYPNLEKENQKLVDDFNKTLEVNTD